MPADSSPGSPTFAAALLTELSGHTVLHFAAHAAIEEEYPWRSRIDPDAGRGHRGAVITAAVITAADIARARLDARLAVLSSCRTAGGRVAPGEGAQGLAGSFLAAGVPSVVATLWPVDDAVAPRFMRRFYAHLAEGAPVAAALAQAQSDLRHEPRWRHPYHWAGYVVIGDGGQVIRPRRRLVAPRTLAAVGLILLGVLALGGGPFHWYIRRSV